MVFLFSFLSFACMPAKKPLVKEPVTEKVTAQKLTAQEPIIEKPTIQLPPAQVPLTPQTRPEEMLPVLDFQLPDLYKQTVTLSSYINKQPVLLFFWTTWCPFCRKELKVLENMQGRLAKEGLELLLINVGESSERVNNFLKKYSLAFKVLLDQDGEAANSFGLLGVPTYILIDKKGYILFRGYSFSEKILKETLIGNE
jgi:peroxiredoxin